MRSNRVQLHDTRKSTFNLESPTWLAPLKRYIEMKGYVLLIVSSALFVIVGCATSGSGVGLVQKKVGESTFSYDDQGRKRAEFINTADGYRLIRWNENGELYVDGLWKNGRPFSGTFHDCDLPADLLSEYMANRNTIPMPIQIEDGVIVKN